MIQPHVTASTLSFRRVLSLVVPVAAAVIAKE